MARPSRAGALPATTGERMSERVSWVTCPHCEARAAVGWRGNTPVEFDCRSGCRIADVDIPVLFASFQGPGGEPSPADQDLPRGPGADDPSG